MLDVGEHKSNVTLENKDGALKINLGLQTWYYCIKIYKWKSIQKLIMRIHSFSTKFSLNWFQIINMNFVIWIQNQRCILYFKSNETKNNSFNISIFWKVLEKYETKELTKDNLAVKKPKCIVSFLVENVRTYVVILRCEWLL